MTRGSASDEGLAAFEAARPNTGVEKNTTAFDSYAQGLNLALQGDPGPDLFAVAFKQGFPEPALDFVEGSNIVGGALYSAPFAKGKTGTNLYINTDLYREAGLVGEGGEPELPVTWAEFAENSRVIRERTGAYGTGFSMLQPWATEWWLKPPDQPGRVGRGRPPWPSRRFGRSAPRVFVHAPDRAPDNLRVGSRR